MLLVEGALRHEHDAKAGSDLERRDTVAAVRIARLVLDENVEAAVEAVVEIFIETGIQDHFQARVFVDIGRFWRLLFAPLFEAIASEILRMKHELPVVDTALDAVVLARDEHVLERAQLLHLTAIQRVAMMVDQVELQLAKAFVCVGVGELASEKDLLVFDELDGRVRAEWVHVADADCWENRDELVIGADRRGHLVLAILNKRFVDEICGQAAVDQCQQSPNEGEKARMRQDDVRHTVHLEPFGVILRVSESFDHSLSHVFISCNTI